MHGRTWRFMSILCIDSISANDILSANKQNLHVTSLNLLLVAWHTILSRMCNPYAPQTPGLSNYESDYSNCMNVLARAPRDKLSDRPCPCNTWQTLSMRFAPSPHDYLCLNALAPSHRDYLCLHTVAPSPRDYLCLHHPAAEATHFVHETINVDDVTVTVVYVLQKPVNDYERPWPSDTSAADGTQTEPHARYSLSHNILLVLLRHAHYVECGLIHHNSARLIV